MPQGLQVWDEDGVEILNTSTRTLIYLGILDITGSAGSGSVTNSRFSKGTPWWVWNCPVSSAGHKVNVSVSGNTLSWTYTKEFYAVALISPIKLIYGIK